MGAVWLGQDEVLGRSVALKRIGFGPGTDDLDLDRAQREARLAARLNHPHVVAVYDLVVEGEDRWLVMEYVEGMTLAELVRRDGALTPDQAAPLLRQAADALAAAHAAGIVHRDVKPSNILVTPEGQVKLSDFGIARAQADASLTQTGLVTGSPAYLAPEVASGQQATAASDVWSLGATLFHALSGRPPYDVGENLLGALYRIVHEEPPRLGASAGWLAPVLLATMAQESADRWSMDQVRDFLVGGPSAPLPAPLPRAVPVGTSEAPVDRSATQVMSTPVQPAPVVPAPAARRRRGHPALILVVAVLVVAVVVVAWMLGSDGDPGSDPGADPGSGATSPSGPTSSAPAKTPEVTADGMENFIEDYLATVTSDPKAAWERLTPDFQKASGGFGQYKKFWSGYQTADLIGNTQADPDNLTITYSVEYLHTDGHKSTDEVTLRLEGTDGDFLIAGES
ncbi:serine/threonine-protein kinase [Nocardioides conyzicola]|uniref:Serine/threonine-protein kinase n=2 Tax=Nocardioides conyzicola TaxID=1651781 RepID=A0ABP8WQM6_9ACTN